MLTESVYLRKRRADLYYGKGTRAIYAAEGLDLKIQEGRPVGGRQRRAVAAKKNNFATATCPLMMRAA